MQNKKLFLLLGDNKDLANRLHSHYVYLSDRDVQTETKKMINDILNDFKDVKLIDIAYDERTRNLMQELIDLKEEPNWKKIVIKMMKGLRDLIDRELIIASAIPRPETIEKQIICEIINWDIFHKTDLIEIKEIKHDIIKVNYLSKRLSPEYNPKELVYDGLFQPWRDTQMMFTLYFNKNLFTWDYINVHESHQGKKIGTNAAKRIEKFVTKLGITRFSVEYPNRNYWIKVMDYEIPYKYRIGSGEYSYTHEGYKEL